MYCTTSWSCIIYIIPGRGQSSIVWPIIIRVVPCLPVGEWSESSPSYSATPLPSSPVAQSVTTGRTRLPLSHGTFIPMTSYEQRGNRRPPQDSSTKSIAIVSITFTVATFLVFVSASVVMFACECPHTCKEWNRSRSHTTSTSTRTLPTAAGTVNMYRHHYM